MTGRGAMTGVVAEAGRGGTGVRAASTGTNTSGASADRKSTRLNSSHANISYAVFCLKKKKRHPRIGLRRHQRRVERPAGGQRDPAATHRFWTAADGRGAEGPRGDVPNAYGEFDRAEV